MSWYQQKQRGRMGTLSRVIICLATFMSSCATQDWRHGNYYSDPKVSKKREKQRDKYMERAEDFRVGTAKHYINEHKKHDGKINLFKRDGFDIGF